MKGKKLAAAVTAAVLAAGMLSGCGTGGTAVSAADSSQDEEYYMTLILSRQKDDFLSSLGAAAKRAAAEHGVMLTTHYAEDDSAQVIRYIEAARLAGDDAVLVNVVDPESGEQCIQAAGDMKIVFVNRSLSDNAVLEGYDNACVVASDENTSGYFQGEYLADYFKKQGKTRISYLMLKGNNDDYSTIHRSQSALEALQDNGIEAEAVTDPLVANFDRNTAENMIEPLLGNTEFDCIISNNDAMALGAIEAMQALGMDPTSIPIVGIDCTSGGAQAIQNGTLAMTVYQDPDGQGDGAVMAALNMLEGKDLTDGTDYQLAEDNDRVVWVPFEPVTSENVDQYIVHHTGE